MLNLSQRGTKAEMITPQPVCLHPFATITMSFAILFDLSSDLYKSFVPMCKVTLSDYSSIVGLMWVDICFVLAPENDLTDTFPFVNYFGNCHPLTFLTIESPNITTLFFTLDTDSLCLLLLLSL